MPYSRSRTTALLAAAALAATASIVRAEDSSAPALLQWFDGSYKTIERRMPDYFMAGYGGLWTPPPGRADSGNSSVGYDVYDRFDLGSAGNPTQYGTETGLKTMIAETHKTGARAYLDLVWNHNGFSQWGTPADGNGHTFLSAGGYPGFKMGAGSGDWGDFHDPSASGDENNQLSGLIDIDQSTNNQYIRNPVSANPNNLPAGTVSAYGRLANTPQASNARFYQDQTSYITVTDPANGNNTPFKIYNFTSNPSGGVPVTENATGYLMRNARWQVQTLGADGFRLDATKNYPDWVLKYLDQAVYGAITTPLLDGSRQNVWSFGEAFDTSPSVLQPRIRHDISSNTVVGGNRDTLDFPLYYAMQNNLSGNGFNNDWRNVVNSSIDGNDDGLANNGSQGVAFVQSHDGSGSPPYLANVAYAYTLMRPGNSIVYFNGNEFGTRGNNFPQQGRGDALGGQYGQTITKLVDIRNRYGNGNYIPRSVTSGSTSDKEDLVYERNRSMIVALSNRLDNGYDNVTVQTSFAAGTPLIELTGNAADPNIDPDNHVPELVVVNGDGTANLTIPRNKNINGTEHDKGYVIYGPSGPQGTLGLSNVARQIASETQTAANNGTARVTAIDVVQSNSFTATLNTNKVFLLGSYRDPNADGDNALIKIDGGLDVNGNGHVDYVTPNTAGYGFEEFTTTHVPGLTSPTNNGVYAQSIDTTGLSEGYHYVEVRAFRHRDPATEGANPPPIYSSFKKVIYVDRVRAPSAISSFNQISGQPNTSRDLVVKSLDGTASDLTNASGNTVKGAHVFYDYGASQRTVDQLVADAYGGQNPTGDYDRDLTKYGLFGVTSGNHAITVVMFEPDYNPALGYAGGGVSVTRFPAIYTLTTNGQGLGDLDFNGSLSPSDPSAFAGVLASNNTSFNPAADLNADGLVDEADDVLMVPWLTFKSANVGTISTATDLRLTRAIALDGTLNIPGGTLNVSGTNVPGVGLTFSNSFNIPAGRTITKTGAQTLTISGPQSPGVGATLAIAEGTANINSNAGSNLTLNVTGSGTQTSLGATQTIKSLSIGAGASVTVPAAGTNLQSGGKVLKTTSLAITGGKLDLANNNAIIDYTGSTPMPDALTQLAAGRNGGAWNGASGIVSSSANTTADLTALAVAEAFDILGPLGTSTALWSGQTVDGTSLLVRYTYAGDATLDGKINVDDYTRIDFNVGLGTSGWYNGDFNYDGKINVDDYTIIDFNVAIQGAPITSASGFTAGVTAIPEPGSFTALACVTSAACLKRKRRTGTR
jgi:alpha-amylase